MSGYVTTLLVGVMMTLPTAVLAQDSRIEDVLGQVGPGERIRIVGATGTVTEGRLDRLSPVSLDVIRKGKSIAIPIGEVDKIQVRRREGDGVLIGFGIGAAVGLGFAQSECRDASEHLDCVWAARIFIAIPMAVVGALFDHGFKRFDTIFERAAVRHTVRLAPVLGADRRGMRVIFSY